MTDAYEKAYAESLSDPEAFWARAAEDIDWDRRWDKVLDASAAPIYRWFTGGRLNTCHNALDRHVAAGRGDQTALIYDSPATGGAVRAYTYNELLHETAKTAGALKALGAGRGDRVIIYMPMVPEAVIAMLAVARLGAVHSVVFGGFAANELAVRIDDCAPKVIMSATCGIEPGRIVEYLPLLNGAVDLAAHKPESCLILAREQAKAELKPGRDHDWRRAVEAADPAPCEMVEAADPLYVLYTSGTTGRPKGVVRDNGGHAVALHWTMENVYNCKAGDVFWAASDVGWVVGHSYIAYAPLLKGCTTVLYEGKPVGTPDAGAFWRVIEQHKVKMLFTAPTAFRAIRREDPDAKLLNGYDLSHFTTLFLAGERTDPDTLAWAEQKLGVPVIDHWWQTETGWPMVSNCMGLAPCPVKPGSPAKPVPGYDVRVVDEQGRDKAPGEIGEIVVRLPLPPGTFPTLWNAEGRFREAYLNDYPGFYKTSDAGVKDEDGYFYIMARTDDIINVAGHRLSTGAIEEALAAHPDVAECAVVGVADELKGQLPVGFLCLKAGCGKSEADVADEAVQLVRERIGPVAAFKTAVAVKRLPKTRSGKILRGTMQKIADNEDWKMPATIDDPAILDEIADALTRAGYARARA